MLIFPNLSKDTLCGQNNSVYRDSYKLIQLFQFFRCLVHIFVFRIGQYIGRRSEFAVWVYLSCSDDLSSSKSLTPPPYQALQLGLSLPQKGNTYHYYACLFLQDYSMILWQNLSSSSQHDYSSIYFEVVIQNCQDPIFRRIW